MQGGDSDPDGPDKISVAWVVLAAVWVKIPLNAKWNHWEVLTREAVTEAHRKTDASTGATELVDPTHEKAMVRVSTRAGGFCSAQRSNPTL